MPGKDSIVNHARDHDDAFQVATTVSHGTAMRLHMMPFAVLVTVTQFRDDSVFFLPDHSLGCLLNDGQVVGMHYRQGVVILQFVDRISQKLLVRGADIERLQAGIINDENQVACILGYGSKQALAALQSFFRSLTLADVLGHPHCQRKTAEEALQRSESLFRAIAEN